MMKVSKVVVFDTHVRVEDDIISGQANSSSMHNNSIERGGDPGESSSSSNSRREDTAEDTGPFLYLVLQLSTTSPNYVKVGCASGSKSKFISRPKVFMPGKIQAHFFDLPYADLKTKLIYEVKVHRAFDSKGWRYQAADEEHEDFVHENISNSENYSTITSPSVENNQRRNRNRPAGSEFFLKFDNEQNFLVNQMLEIMKTTSLLSISNIMNGTEWNGIEQSIGQGVNRSCSSARDRESAGLQLLQFHRPSRANSPRILTSSQSDVNTFFQEIYEHEGYAKHNGSDQIEGGGAQPLSMKSAMNIAEALLQSYENDTNSSKSIKLLQVGQGYGEECVCITHYLLKAGVPSENIRIWGIDNSLNVCEKAVELIRKLDLEDNVKIDFKDFLTIPIQDLAPFDFNYIASSAAVNNLFYLRLLQVAIELRVPNLLVSKDHVIALNNMDIIESMSRKNKYYHCSKFADAEVQPNRGVAKGCKRDVYRIETNHSSMQYTLEKVKKQIKFVFDGMNDRTFGHEIKVGKEWAVSSRLSMDWKARFRNISCIEDSLKRQRVEKLLQNCNNEIRFELCPNIVKDKYILGVDDCIKFAECRESRGGFFMVLHCFFESRLQFNNYYILDN